MHEVIDADAGVGKGKAPEGSAKENLEFVAVGEETGAETMTASEKAKLVERVRFRPLRETQPTLTFSTYSWTQSITTPSTRSRRHLLVMRMQQ